ncbi:MAG: HAD-IIA family hydrolase [Candidatus Caldatribacteriaceae bacterium]
MKLKNIRTFLLDMDGTVYLGDQLLPGVREFFDTLREKGYEFYFLTNNSSRHALFYASKLQKMGLRWCTPSHVITSGEACTFYLQKFNPRARVFLLGTRELEIEFLRAGFTLVQNDPDFVVLGFDKTLTYRKLDQACAFIRQGIPFFATHPDLACPGEERPLLDMGCIIRAIEAFTGKSPRVFGKPHPEMIEYALWRTGGQKETMAMIGDRLYTDIAMGKRAGITSILVLTGETRKEDIPSSPWQPDFIFPSLRELQETLAKEMNQE